MNIRTSARFRESFLSSVSHKFHVIIHTPDTDSVVRIRLPLPSEFSLAEAHSPRRCKIRERMRDKPGATRRKRRRFKGWYCRSVQRGNGGVITDISFQQGDQDIKVARGNHYSDIVRSSLFRVSILLAPPPLVPFYLVSSLSLRPFPRARSISFSLFIPRCLFEYIVLSRQRKRTKNAEGRSGSLSEFLVRVAVTLSQIHFAVGEFPLVHVPGIGTRAAFQSREFLRRFLPLLPRAFFPPSSARPPTPSLLLSPPSSPSSYERLENGAAEKIREALLNGLYLICARGSSEGIRRDYSREEWKRSTGSASYRIFFSIIGKHRDASYKYI